MEKRETDIYLLVDSSEVKEIKYRPISNKIRSLIKVFTLSEYDYADINIYFKKNDVPMDFRKIVVILHGMFSSKNEAEELFTGVPFDISGYTKIEKDRSKQIIRGITHDNRRIMFSTKADFIDFNDIKNFYLLLKENNLFEKYINAMNVLFGVNYAINEEKVETKVRKLEL